MNKALHSSTRSSLLVFLFFGVIVVVFRLIDQTLIVVDDVMGLQEAPEGLVVAHVRLRPKSDLDLSEPVCLSALVVGAAGAATHQVDQASVELVHLLVDLEQLFAVFGSDVG